MAAPAAGSPDPASRADELPIDVELIKVLASDTRRDILRMLGERRKTLTELSDALNLKKATILEHLQKLVAAGLIKRLDQDDRLWVYYELTPRGKRLVRPERTRFYLILGGTAVAALLLGAVVAVAMFGQFGGAPSQASDELSAGPATLADDRAGETSAWRGLDREVRLALQDAPEDATLLLKAADNTSHAIPIADGAATLDAARLDALPPGRYGLSLYGDAGEAPLPRSLVVQEPTLALFPLAATNGTPVTLELALAPPQVPPPAGAELHIDGEPLQLDATPASFQVVPDGNGTTIEVGRLHQVELRVLPAFAMAARQENGTLHLSLSEHGAPLEGAEVLLDDASLGRTDAAGELQAPWPEPGEHALRIVDAEGRALERAFAFDAVGAAELEPRLEILALDARVPGGEGMRVRAEVRNHGVADAVVTVAAREGGALLATTLLDVPAGGSAQAVLSNALARPVEIDVAAHAARSTSFTQLHAKAWDVSEQDHATDQDDAANASAGAADAGEPAPAAAPMVADEEAQGRLMRSESMYAYRSAPADARTTLYFGSPTIAAAEGADAASAARTPGPSVLALALAVAMLALVLRRRAGR